MQATNMKLLLPTFVAHITVELCTVQAQLQYAPAINCTREWFSVITLIQ